MSNLIQTLETSAVTRFTEYTGQQDHATALANGLELELLTHDSDGKIYQYYPIIYLFTLNKQIFQNDGTVQPCKSLFNIAESKFEAVSLSKELQRFEDFIAYLRNNPAMRYEKDSTNWVGYDRIGFDMDEAIRIFCKQNSFQWQRNEIGDGLKPNICLHCFGELVREKYFNELFIGNSMGEWSDIALTPENTLEEVLREWESFIMWVVNTY